MLRLHLRCNQGGHTPSGRCICNNLAKVCTCVGTAATMTKTYYQKNTTLTSKQMTLVLWNAQVASMLQPRWSHPFWQVHLQNQCTNIHLYGHSDQHDQIILSKKHNPNLKIDDSRVVECSGCIYVLSKVAHPFWQVYLQQFCTSLHFYGHSGQHDQNILFKRHNPKLKLDVSRVVVCSGCI